MIYHLVTYIGMDALLKSATNQVALVASSTVWRTRIVGRTFRQEHEIHLQICRGFSTILGLNTHALLSTMLTAAIVLAPTDSTSRQITA